MRLWAAVLVVAVVLVGSVSAAETWTTQDLVFDGNGACEYPNSGWIILEAYDKDTTQYTEANIVVHYTSMNLQCVNVSASGTFAYNYEQQPVSVAASAFYRWYPTAGNPVERYLVNAEYSDYACIFSGTADEIIFKCMANIRIGTGGLGHAYTTVAAYISPYIISEHNVTGTTGCLDNVALYVEVNNTYALVTIDDLVADAYSFTIIYGQKYRLIFSDGAYYDFTCTGDEVVDYDLCLYVYGYTCGVGDIHLYVDDGGWVLNDSVSQGMGLSDYEMVIYSGEDYKLEFYGVSQLVDTYLFSCTGDHVLYIYDRCVYPPGPGPYDPVDPIIIWEGYDYNIVVFRDEHGNRVENAQVAVYDQTNSTYIQRWTPNPDGYLLLGALFNDSDHAVQILMRTFDGVFTLETTYPANGSAPVGSEDVTQTNMTIPIHYNIRMHPVDNTSMPIPGVFCGLSEYTPHDPLSFWGYSMYGRTTVPIGGCSGFAMCDLFAEKGGYTTYNVTALNWTSRSAMVKDYRHIVTMGAQAP